MTVTTPPRPETDHDRDLELRVGALETRIEEVRGRARRRRIHAGVVLGLTLILAAIVFASGSPAAGPRPCTGSKPGWWVQCGPASAVVAVRGVSHAIANGACNGPRGGRLDFGIYSPRATPHVGLGLRFETVRAGTVKVVDGELELVPGIRVALTGTAHVDPGFRSGTFSVYGRGADGRHIGGPFTGSWTCG